MYNSDTPLHAELPTSRQLLRSTVLAVISAAVILVAVVLPAEYGIDPTGLGRVLQLTEMGQIKAKLVAQAVADESAAATPVPVPEPSVTQPPAVVAAPLVAAQPTATQPLADAPWRDQMAVTLKPDQGIEIKMRMNQGDKAQYAWVAEGGVVNFDTHGDSGGRSISYEKGRAVPGDEGELEAAFTGNHGWYWRNRTRSEVKIILRTRGQYADIKRVL